MSVWDDPDMRPPADDFVKLDVKGDKLSGVITNVRSHRFSDTDVAPQITFVDDRSGEEKTWTAGQLQSKRKLAELRPEIGDWFSAELTDVEKRGTKTLKHIDIQVNRGGKPATQAPAQAVPQPAAAAPDMAAVLAQLSPEQRAALVAQQNTAPPF